MSKRKPLLNATEVRNVTGLGQIAVTKLFDPYQGARRSYYTQQRRYLPEEIELYYRERIKADEKVLDDLAALVEALEPKTPHAT